MLTNELARSLGILLVLTIFAAPAMADGSGEVFLEANFDTHALGPIGSGGAPAGEPVFIPGGLTATVTDTNGTGQQLTICDKNTLFPQFMSFEFLDLQNITEGTVCVTYTVNFVTMPVGNLWEFDLRTQGSVSTTELFLKMRFNTGPTINFIDADDLVVYKTHPFVVGVPMDFKIEIDMDAGTYDVSIDDSLIVDDEDHGVIGSGFGRVQFGAGIDFNQGDCIVVDDLLVQTAGTQTGVAGTTPMATGRVTFAGAAPNPFNPVTNFGFDISESGNVRLDIFDPSGRLVDTILEGWMSAGNHSTRWNGRDAQGRPLSSGVYFARLEALGERTSRSVILVK